MDILQLADLTLWPLIVSFLLCFTTFVLLFWYSARKQSYWKKIGIPYVTPSPFFGSVLENLKKPLHEAELERYFKLGKIYGHYEGNRPLLSVGDPELLRSILVKDFNAFNGRRDLKIGDEMAEKMLNALQGEDWKRVRSIVSPTFSTGKIKRMLGIFKDCARALVKNFKEATKRGESIEVKSFYGAFTMDIIASAAFSTKIDSHNDPNNKFVVTARDLFSKKRNWRFIFFTICPGLMKFFRIPTFSPKGFKFFSDVTLQIIDERKRTGQTRNDFLQLLMDTAKELSDEGKLDVDEKGDIAENYGEEGNDQILKTIIGKKSLSHNELVAQCVIFFLAGYDTTASTLSFASYLLALNPDIQEKLIHELDETLKSNNGELIYEAVQSMKYLDNVISETLRIYPPAIRLERVADEDYKLGDTGLTIPKGMIVTIPAYAMHHDPSLFPDPEKFDPDRFTPEERSKRSQYAYLPFGAGPRNCVGMRFALMEAKVCLAHVLSNFRIKKCSETKVPLEFYTAKRLLQTKGITLRMEERKDTVNAL